jgi:hypothetical protein
MSLHAMSAALLILALAATGAAAKPFAVALHVREDAGVARIAEPLASGLPLPQGAVFNPADLRVTSPTGQPVPCQAHQLGLSWPDGSLRWVLVQFQATVAANKDAIYTLMSDPGKPPVLPREHVSVANGVVGGVPNPDAVQVTTGPLRFTVSRSDFRLPNTLASALAPPRSPPTHPYSTAPASRSTPTASS